MGFSEIFSLVRLTELNTIFLFCQAGKLKFSLPELLSDYEECRTREMVHGYRYSSALAVVLTATVFGLGGLPKVAASLSLLTATFNFSGPIVEWGSRVTELNIIF